MENHNASIGVAVGSEKVRLYSTLNSEEIKPTALAIIELGLSVGIS